MFTRTSVSGYHHHGLIDELTAPQKGPMKSCEPYSGDVDLHHSTQDTVAANSTNIHAPSREVRRTQSGVSSEQAEEKKLKVAKKEVLEYFLCTIEFVYVFLKCHRMSI